jgi:hypothetical protein
VPNTTDAELKALEHMTVADLQQRYLEVFGEPTRAHHRVHLVRTIAWRIQALREGGLSERARKRAEELANDADLRLRPPRTKPSDGPTVSLPLGPARDPRLPSPGTVLRRNYKRKTLVVKVLERGFEFQGETYRSLSAVAEAATGAHWNGMTFFGLAGKESKP